MRQSLSDGFPEALPHGQLEEIFPDVFFISGAMETTLQGLDWTFSRNMTVIREDKRLVLINSVRLDDAGLAALDSLGQVTDVIRLGVLHGRDDPFYVQRYGARYWALPGVEHEQGLSVTDRLTPDAQLPLRDASLFSFQHTAIPEGLLHLSREGGIVIACDALQNWRQEDEYFCHETCQRMREMGFFTPANVGPVWQQVAQPGAEDFVRLKQLSFKHALCGHGEPLYEHAAEAYSETFHRLWAI